MYTTAALLTKQAEPYTRPSNEWTSDVDVSSVATKMLAVPNEQSDDSIEPTEFCSFS